MIYKTVIFHKNSPQHYEKKEIYEVATQKKHDIPHHHYNMKN